MRTKAGFGVAVLGVIVLVAGIVSLIIGLTHNQVQATVKSGKSSYIMTEPGVLDLVNTKVHVTVKAAHKDSTVTLGIGASEDVQAWSQDLPVFDVSGLKDWQNFKGKDRKPNVEETPDVTGSDLWGHEESGQGYVSFDYKVTAPGNTSLIAHSSDNQPVTMTVSWKRPHIVVDTLPVLVIGGLLIAIGVVLSLMGRREGEETIIEWYRSVRGKPQKKKKAGKGASGDRLDISDLDIFVPSRDELVSQERDQQQVSTSGALGAGIIPPTGEDFLKHTAEFTLPDSFRSSGN
ncbi:MAG: hypothetical protein IKZ87_00350 [Actinomycetaceae bacterium]|nr:hypothetical protein [Actinomycetaceae bacterium]